MPMNILGLSFFYHESAACLLQDGQIVAAVQEERLSRKKHDAVFPVLAIQFCLNQAGISIEDIDYIVFYEKPFKKFERILFSAMAEWPRGIMIFPEILNLWLGKKIKTENIIRNTLSYDGNILYMKHHEAHGASSFYCSSFQEAAIVTIDGVGEWATATIGIGRDNKIKTLSEIRFPNSLGLLYSAFTYYLGFKVNDGEYKVMGLAPYGKPIYKKLIKDNLISLKGDGSFALNTDYFIFQNQNSMIRIKNFEKLFGNKKRSDIEPLEQVHKDIAASIQSVLEDALLLFCEKTRDITKMKRLCLAGGVALNCVANSTILQSGIFDDVYVFPSPGDSGAAAGTALWAWHHFLNNPKRDQGIHHVYWGPSYSDESIKAFLDRIGIHYEKMSQEQLVKKTADLLCEQKIVGWFQGRMEFGPRALGNRSILADPRYKENWDKLNLRIKFRESFRPYAPSVLEEYSFDYFDLSRSSPFMLFTSKNKTREIPAVTHVDNTSRLHTVSEKTNPLFHLLIREFYDRTGVPVLINTSFNMNNEPIVCNPQDAYRCFLVSGIDVLVLGSYLIDKKININN